MKGVEKPDPQKLKQVVIRDNIPNFLCIIYSVHAGQGNGSLAPHESKSTRKSNLCESL